MALQFEYLASDGRDWVGPYLPHFFNEADPSTVFEQLHTSYVHGGGWHPFKGFTMNPINGDLGYPGDPIQKPVAKAIFREHVIYVYRHSWVAVTEGTSFQICRMD